MDEKSIYVTKASLPPFEEYVEAIKPLWESGRLTNMGEFHKELEKKLDEFLDVRYISLFVNGHMSLELLLQALNLSGEVITTPYTFASTTHAIVRNHLKPVFCDVNESDFTMDVTKIENLITEQTTAILPVHVYGNVCDMEKIDRIAKKYKLKVIYDAAHAFGVKVNGQGIGNFGDASAFSFHATKAFNTIEGGAVTSKDIDVLKKLYKLKNFGFQNEVTVDGVGANAKMNEFQAIMGLCNLKNFEKEVSARKKIIEYYRKRLQGVTGLKLSIEDTRREIESNYSYFPIIIDEDKFGCSRDDIKDILNLNNIYPRKYFYPLTSAFQCYEGEFNPEETPVAFALSKRVLTLPIYADLDLEVVERICNIILEQRFNEEEANA